MKNSTIVWTIVILAIIAIGIWAYSSMNSAGQYAVSTPQDNNSAGNLTPLVLNTMKSPSSTIGTYLVASNGMTLYLYTPDAKNVSNCYGQCAANWPPYTVSSTVNLAGGTNVTGQISTITRSDGKMQVAYKGIPLYFWIKDKVPGDTTGQNVGGVWFVVNP